MAGITSVGTSSILAYKLVNAQYDKQVAQFAKTDSQYKQLTDHFTQVAPTINSVDALLNDRKALQVALGAFQLQDQVDATGLIKKLLTEDPTAATSLANRLNDPRYLQFAKAFQGLNSGSAILSDPTALNAVLTAYKTNSFEAYEGDQNQAVREALYFKRSIGAITSWNQVIASAPLAKVVRGALGLPDSFGALDATQQNAYLSAHYDIKKFTDSGEVDKFVQRYLANVDAQNTTTSPMVSLLSGGDGSSASDNILGALMPASSSSNNIVNLLI